MSSLWIAVAPDVQDLITEDDTPVDNIPSEKQQRLLTEPLYSSWQHSRPGGVFLAAANVGIFAAVRNPAIVPDMFLSLDVNVSEDWWRKEHRSYFLWEFGKPPEVVLEIVSNTEGRENTTKRQRYAQMRVEYYVIYDPLKQIMDTVLTVYRLDGRDYRQQTSAILSDVGLGLTLWEGVYEGKHDTWLRWTDADGHLILTGKERAEQADQRAEQADQRAEQADQRAEQERQRAEQERQRAEQERQRAEETLLQLRQAQERAAQLTAMLRQLGQEPPQP